MLLTNFEPGSPLLADKARNSNTLREQAKEQDVWANIPSKSTPKGSFVFSALLYRYRSRVERFFNKLKEFRGVATRYDKDPESFLVPPSWSQLASGCAVMSPLLNTTFRVGHAVLAHASRGRKQLTTCGPLPRSWTSERESFRLDS